MLWGSSLAFAGIIGLGVLFFREPIFTWLLGFAALLHVVIVIRTASEASAALAASQLLVVVVTLASVIGYLFHWVGPAEGVSSLLLEILTRPWPPSAVTRFGAYAALRIAVASISFLLVFLLPKVPSRPHAFIAALYATGAANVAWDYARLDPLASVSAWPEPSSTYVFSVALAHLDFALLFFVLASLPLILSRLARACRRQSPGAFS